MKQSKNEQVKDLMHAAKINLINAVRLATGNATLQPEEIAELADAWGSFVAATSPFADPTEAMDLAAEEMQDALLRIDMAMHHNKLVDRRGQRSQQLAVKMELNRSGVRA